MTGSENKEPIIHGNFPNPVITDFGKVFFTDLFKEETKMIADHFAEIID
jgi:hypothetical protein